MRVTRRGPCTSRTLRLANRGGMPTSPTRARARAKPQGAASARVSSRLMRVRGFAVVSFEGQARPARVETVRRGRERQIDRLECPKIPRHRRIDAPMNVFRFRSRRRLQNCDDERSHTIPAEPEFLRSRTRHIEFAFAAIGPRVGYPQNGRVAGLGIVGEDDGPVRQKRTCGIVGRSGRKTAPELVRPHGFKGSRRQLS